MIPFNGAFLALTGHIPFKWQKRLYERLASGNIPRCCDLPTGLGKTSVIPIWLIALAHGAPGIPRRLVYIVNRRTVVDQATDEAVKLRERLSKPSGEHKDVLDGLRSRLVELAGGDGNPLAVSTLRGELADNGEWRANPAKPAIVIGTVDMIGSKLLFQGYGDGRYWRPHHAGLLGQDALIVHDEAHLTPAFSALIRHIGGAQAADSSTRPLRIMELSATTPTQCAEDAPPFGLVDEDEQDPIVRHRLDARKLLMLHPPQQDRKAVVQKLIELALEHRDARCRVLAYVTSPEDAQAIQAGLLQAGVAPDQVALLTGTLRGYERDKLAETPLFKWFLGADAMDSTAYLVSTSAGEVGVDLDADHMVCDLSTLESMIQRLGRVNRKPELAPEPHKKVALIDVVPLEAVTNSHGKPAKGEDERLFKARQNTWQALSQLPPAGNGRLDASPRALRKISGMTEAWSPPPVIPVLSDILLDAWALTSFRTPLPNQPPVEDWLHGIAGWEPPETYVAWRAELSALAEADVSPDEIEDALEVFPLRAAERLRDRTDRVQRELAKIASCHPKAQALVIRNGARWCALGRLAGEDLRYATVILPAEAGGLDAKGFLRGEVEDPAKDVAETTVQGQRARQRVWIDAQGTPEALDGGQVKEDLIPRLRILLRRDEFPAEEGAEGQRVALEYRIGPADPGESLGAGECKEPVLLKDHTPAVARHTACIVAALGLPREIADALKLAAEWHDNGKARGIWQRAAGNSDPANPLAKSGRRGLNWRALEDYRHELGSLLDAASDPAIQQHAERDLILHLIAAHHGWARPHFEPNAHDNSEGVSTQENQDAIQEAMRRYARLQQRFGRWGLAWLEALLRCADGLASANPSPASQEPQS